MNPGQLVRRCYRRFFPPVGDRMLTRLPWGWQIEVPTREEMSTTLIYLGVYDLVVSEVIWRLCDLGETAIDVGANIGYVTALLAKRVGRSGHVLAFEAHPEIVKELEANVSRWRYATGPGVIQIFGLALSDREGFIQFVVPPEFATNRGTSYVSEGPILRQGGTGLSVPSSTLDAVLSNAGAVGVAKMDVEGHEENVLLGARGALESRSIRDWVFEHHAAYPSSTTDMLEKNGYTVFQLQKRFVGPRLVPVATPAQRSRWEPTSFLATLDPSRALERMRGGGWRVLNNPRWLGMLLP